MRQRRNTLHLNRIHILQRMIQNPRCVNNLPSHISIIQVSNEEGFGGESVGLDIDVCACNFVDERGFSDVGVSADEKSASGGVNGGETGDVLTDLFEVS